MATTVLRVRLVGGDELVKHVISTLAQDSGVRAAAIEVAPRGAML